MKPRDVSFIKDPPLIKNTYSRSRLLKLDLEDHIFIEKIIESLVLLKTEFNNEDGIFNNILLFIFPELSIKFSNDTKVQINKNAKKLANYIFQLKKLEDDFKNSSDSIIKNKINGLSKLLNVVKEFTNTMGIGADLLLPSLLIVINKIEQTDRKKLAEYLKYTKELIENNNANSIFDQTGETSCFIINLNLALSFLYKDEFEKISTTEKQKTLCLQSMINLTANNMVQSIGESSQRATHYTYLIVYITTTESDNLKKLSLIQTIVDTLLKEWEEKLITLKELKTELKILKNLKCIFNDDSETFKKITNSYQEIRNATFQKTKLIGKIREGKITTGNKEKIKEKLKSLSEDFQKTLSSLQSSNNQKKTNDPLPHIPRIIQYIEKTIATIGYYNYFQEIHDFHLKLVSMINQAILVSKINSQKLFLVLIREKILNDFVETKNLFNEIQEITINTRINKEIKRIKFLIDSNSKNRLMDEIDFNKLNKNYFLPFHYAVINGKFKSLKVLLGTIKTSQEKDGNGRYALEYVNCLEFKLHQGILDTIFELSKKTPFYNETIALIQSCLMDKGIVEIKEYHLAIILVQQSLLAMVRNQLWNSDSVTKPDRTKQTSISDQPKDWVFISQDTDTNLLQEYDVTPLLELLSSKGIFSNHATSITIDNELLAIQLSSLIKNEEEMRLLQTLTLIDKFEKNLKKIMNEMDKANLTFDKGLDELIHVKKYLEQIAEIETQINQYLSSQDDINELFRKSKILKRELVHKHLSSLKNIIDVQKKSEIIQSESVEDVNSDTYDTSRLLKILSNEIDKIKSEEKKYSIDTPLTASGIFSRNASKKKTTTDDEAEEEEEKKSPTANQGQ